MIGTGKCGSLFGTNLKLNMTIMHRSKPESKFLFNPGEVFIQTIIVDRVPECVIYGLANIGGGAKGTRSEYPPCKISVRQLDTPIYQVSVAEWVVLRQILEIYDSETEYEGGWRRCETWWRQTAAWNQLSVTFKHILAEARARRWESGRCGEGGRAGR